MEKIIIKLNIRNEPKLMCIVTDKPKLMCIVTDTNCNKGQATYSYIYLLLLNIVQFE